MGMLENDWVEAIGEEFKKPYYSQLYQFIKEEYNTKVIYPPADDIFNAVKQSKGADFGAGSLP